jgi:hypothetical protein
MDKVRVFTQDHLILGNVDNFPCEAKYETQSDAVYSTSENIHRGQRKLLLSEIQFMTSVHTQRANTYCDIQADAPFLCVYAGAYPCIHLLELMKMFPNVSFVLVDPAFSSSLDAFARKWDKTRVVVWAELFTEKTVDIINAWRWGFNSKRANLNLKSTPDSYVPYFKDLNRLSLFDWESREDILFVSDIRLEARNETFIKTEMDMQAIWFHQLQASTGLLKFRLPYVTEEWVANQAQHHLKYVYLEGVVHMPIWGPKSTTECRLMVKKNCGVAVYDPVIHERKFAGFNQYERKMPYIYNNIYFESFDQAATAMVEMNYWNYVNNLLK